MCGIAGIFYRDGNQVQADLLSKMTRVLYHRGPDYGAVWHKAQFGLGHRRLKIIDLSDSSNQPMTNEDRTIWLSFNGEIYNYKDLKEILIKCGHVFRSNSDTEVILHAYEEWGLDCLGRMNGMFALGLVDLNKKCLLLARDRLGIKPLFYFYNDKKLLFASEIKAILMDPSLMREIEPKSLDTFLSFNYVAAPNTMFKGIHQVLPGEYLFAGNDFLQKNIYWKPSFVADDHMTQEECDRLFIELFSASVERRLGSDVPFGAFLSGGLDSSSVVSLMARYKRGCIKTFSIDFEENDFSEASNAQCVASHLGLEHYVKTMGVPQPEFFRRIVWSSEEPTADASAIPMHMLS
ncbi:MAG: asparagine synthase (glutamine-hydrolyzing), partial [Candidatus Omnitrophica bacterium]|nr:asparagine synthase (glutamine-hydrolyzing) [Candidatus Omnitrophota bacterium]